MTVFMNFLAPLFLILSIFFWAISECFVFSTKMKNDTNQKNKHLNRISEVATLGLFSFMFLLVFLNSRGISIGFIKEFWVAFAGFIFTILGISFRQYSIHVLGQFFSGYVRITNEHQLIQKGPYKYFRHPSYFGSLLCYLGISLSSQNWIVSILFLFVMVFVYYNRIKVEEDILILEFKGVYEEYKKKTWGFLPFLK